MNDSFLRALHRVWDKHGDKALATMAQEHPCQLVTQMFKLLPKETEVESDNTLEYEPLSATLAWVKEIVGSDEHQEELEPEPGDPRNMLEV